MPIFALIFLALLFHGCGENQSSRDDVPPSAPRWVPRTPDDEYAQTGIRAEPAYSENQYLVRVEWYANSEPDVTGYIILRRPEWESDVRRAYPVADLLVGVDLPLAGPYSWVDEGRDWDGTRADLLAPDPNHSDSTRGYYWQIVAYDEAGNWSPRSESIYYRLVNNPEGLRVTSQGQGSYLIHWQFRPNPEVILSYHYVFRLYSRFWGPDSVHWFVGRRFNYDTDVLLMLNTDSLARPLWPDCTYVWQLNVVANGQRESHAEPLAGSSVAAIFTAQN